ncbi:MAG: serine hydrolase [Bacteroidales bacterium]|nr:serine hydrolase [Bacteroidales bacterium]
MPERLKYHKHREKVIGIYPQARDHGYIEDRGCSRRISMQVIILAICLSWMTMGCHVGRYFIWNFADLNDYRRFPSLPVHSSQDDRHDLTYKERAIQLPETYSGQYEHLDIFLEKHSTVAFLVVQRDTLIYERYFTGYDQRSVIPSFSISKVFVSALTGIALNEGYIGDVHQPVTDYLTWLDSSQFGNVTLEHLLNMRSGIQFSESYISPFSEMAKYYYGRDLTKSLHRLKTGSDEPGRSYEYVSVNTLLLGLVIEEAAGMKLSSYLETKIWKPLGMESDATWSVDSKPHNTIKSFCCLNAVPRDFARFGMLYLNDGNWAGRQIIPADWVKRSTSVMNDSRDDQGYPYTYSWRVMEQGAFFAKGILGQYIWVCPEKDLVMVRMGKKYSGTDWAMFCWELSRQL